MRIVFMGTPDFAVESLKILIENNYQVVAVITAADKPAGRGQQLAESPVKKYALSQNIPILQPEKLKNVDFLEQLKLLQADLQVVVAFRMLPELIWAMPPKGTINLHASLLPDYRGAAPINWAIINGETLTGVSTFFIEKEIDTGKVVFTEEVNILPQDNAGTLHDRLMYVGANLILKTVRAIEKNDYPQLSQILPKEPKLAPKIFKESCAINWAWPAKKVHDFVRGLSPYPAAWTLLNGKTCKIFDSTITDFIFDDACGIGEFYSDNKNVLAFRCVDKFLIINELQLEGKKKMNVSDFLMGYKL